MKLLSFLVKNFRGVAVLAILAGLAAGITNTGLLALINAVLTGTDKPTSTLGWWFIALCALMLLTRIVSEAVLIRISVNAAFNLRMRLSRQMLSAPFVALKSLAFIVCWLRLPKMSPA